MSNARELLQSYLDNIREPGVAAALFADDGIVELPTAKARAQGPMAIGSFLSKLLQMMPDFRFESAQFWIEAPDRVFAK